MVQVSSLIALGALCLSVSATPVATQKGVQAAPATPKAPGGAKPATAAAAPKTPAAAAGGQNSGTVKIAAKPASNKPKAPRPDHMKGLPAGTHVIAFDEAKGKVHAFDKGMKHIGSVNAVGKGGKALVPKPGKADSKTAPAGPAQKPGTSSAQPAKMVRQKRDDVSACTPLSSDDIQKLPGWNAIKSAAEAAWGTGSYNLVANDKDYPDYPATSCVDQSPSMLVVNGKPQCTTASSSLQGTLANDGTVAVTHQFGTSYETSMTVTKESSMSIGATLSAEFGIEGVGSVGASTTWSASMTNSLAKGTTASSNTMESHTITMNSSGGQSCSLDVNTDSCQIQGSGKVRVTASGWVWFEYNDRTHDHYKWAMSIDNTVKNIDDRSSYMEYKAQVSSKTATKYKSNCKVTGDNKTK